MGDKINWDAVNQHMESGELEGAIVRPYGLPEFLNPLRSVYAPDIEVQPRWEIPDKLAICSAVVGAMHSKRTNPHHPMTVEEIKKEALECCAAGAANVHIHVRDANGINVLDLEKLHQVIDPIREQYPDVLVCGCLVPTFPGDWARVTTALEEGLVDQTPVNAIASYIGDSVLVKPPHAMIKKAELCEKNDVKPQIAVYSDGDIDNARRYLVETGLLRKPYYWILLPGLVGCSPMYTPMSMVDTLMGYVRRIREIDPDSRIMCAAAGRASSHIATLSMLLGLNIRIGMEDTIWKFPHRDDLITSNSELYKQIVSIATALGREPASPDEYVEMMGLRRKGGRVIEQGAARDC
ncbi:MAG: 3-keto-5-aminohexanoate cleavage protein [Deltaproteobacteria bacterium]|jgi:3-keto-5-aminohexanoate cleavage enzyme|nr:3-keto-5-aminohexanoate cleavage protein [Deltaproteobacteria bacterium]